PGSRRPTPFLEGERLVSEAGPAAFQGTARWGADPANYVRDLLVGEKLQRALRVLGVQLDALPLPRSLPHGRMWREEGAPPPTLHDLFAYYAHPQLHPLPPASSTAVWLNLQLQWYLEPVLEKLRVLGGDHPASHIAAGPGGAGLRLCDLIALLLLPLYEREVWVLALHNGLWDDADLTLEEIARLDGVTPERIRQVKSRALRRMEQEAHYCGKEEVGALFLEIVRPYLKARGGTATHVEMGVYLRSRGRVGPLSAAHAVWFLAEHTGVLKQVGPVSFAL
ncbi:MAG TPA: sigma factor-like helix-turn-helix DNA-binding protein, partial [Chloroflexota bacterium]|nr:sigma factor-like helix-turn-helix DNA-binding protein [Chloroflexota bacterium]